MWQLRALLGLFNGAGSRTSFQKALNILQEIYNFMIVGFTFTKLSAEKKGQAKGKIDISNNVSIRDVIEDSFSLGKSKEQVVLRILFESVSKYEPNVGSIVFEGDLLYLEDPKRTKDILNSWSKDKKLPKDIVSNVFNTIFNKCNVQALILSQEVNLPPPIRMPKLEVSQQA